MNKMIVRTDPVQHEGVEGQTERQEQEEEEDEDAGQSSDDLTEHHHVDPQMLEPATDGDSDQKRRNKSRVWFN